MKKHYFSALALTALTAVSLPSCSDDEILNEQGNPTTTTASQDIAQMDGKAFSNLAQLPLGETRASAIVIRGDRAAVGNYDVIQSSPYSLSTNATVVYTDEEKGEGYFLMDDGSKVAFCSYGGIFTVDEMPGSTLADQGQCVFFEQTDDDGALTRGGLSVKDIGKITIKKTACKLAGCVPGVGFLLKDITGAFIDSFCSPDKEGKNQLAEISDQIAKLQQEVTALSDQVSEENCITQYKSNYLENLGVLSNFVSGRTDRIITSMWRAKIEGIKEGLSKEQIHARELAAAEQEVRKFAEAQTGVGSAGSLKETIDSFVKGYCNDKNSFELIDSYAYYTFPFEQDAYAWREMERLKQMKLVTEAFMLLALQYEICGDEATFTHSGLVATMNNVKKMYQEQGVVNHRDDGTYCQVEGATFAADRYYKPIDFVGLADYLKGNDLYEDDSEQNPRFANYALEKYTDHKHSVSSDTFKKIMGVNQHNIGQVVRQHFALADGADQSTYASDKETYVILDDGYHRCDNYGNGEPMGHCSGPRGVIINGTLNLHSDDNEPKECLIGYIDRYISENIFETVKWSNFWMNENPEEYPFKVGRNDVHFFTIIVNQVYGSQDEGLKAYRSNCVTPMTDSEMKEMQQQSKDDAEQVAQQQAKEEAIEEASTYSDYYGKGFKHLTIKEVKALVNEWRQSKYAKDFDLEGKTNQQVIATLQAKGLCSIYVNSYGEYVMLPSASDYEQQQTAQQAEEDRLNAASLYVSLKGEQLTVRQMESILDEWRSGDYKSKVDYNDAYATRWIYDAAIDSMNEDYRGKDNETILSNLRKNGLLKDGKLPQVSDCKIYVLTRKLVLR